MATVAIAFVKPHVVNQNGAVVLSTDWLAEVGESSGSSTTFSSVARTGDVLKVSVAGGMIGISIGPSPDAEVSPIVLMDGSTEYFGVLPGDQVAVVDIAIEGE